MATGKKSLSIVIPNYNGRQLLETYLPYTFTAAKQADIPFEIIVVDDRSIDESVQYLRAEYPQIKLLINAENKGFSYSCNRGIEAAQHELILLLNSDVKLLPDYFDHQWRYFDDTDTFGVMGRIIDMQGNHIQDAARVPRFNGFKLKTDYFYYSNDAADKSLTFYLSGANALMDAKKLKTIGGFCELFSPFYCEDIELSLRAWRMGWKCYYDHPSVCRHQMSASTKNYQTARWVKSIYFRNRFYLHALHLSGLARFAWFMQITVVDLLPKMLIGQIWIWKSYLSLFANRKAISAYKKQIEQLIGSNSISVNTVINQVRQSVKSKAITRFKP